MKPLQTKKESEWRGECLGRPCLLGNHVWSKASPAHSLSCEDLISADLGWSL